MTRLLDDGCIACNLSQVACDAREYVHGARCCPWCEHSPLD